MFTLTTHFVEDSLVPVALPRVVVRAVDKFDVNNR